jgi:hypothetical protein
VAVDRGRAGAAMSDVERERDRYKAALEAVSSEIDRPEIAYIVRADAVQRAATIIREALALSEAEQAAVEAAGPEPDLPPPLLIDSRGFQGAPSSPADQQKRLKALAADRQRRIDAEQER